jgi:hypothetical protein
LILTFGAISIAHFSPAVTLADASQSGLAWREVPVYLPHKPVGPPPVSLPLPTSNILASTTPNSSATWNYRPLATLRE